MKHRGRKRAACTSGLHHGSPAIETHLFPEYLSIFNFLMLKLYLLVFAVKNAQKMTSNVQSRGIRREMSRVGFKAQKNKIKSLKGLVAA